jgi:hypothetical protein
MVCLKLRRGDREQRPEADAPRRLGTVSPSRLRGRMTATCFTARPALDAALDAALVEALVEVETS